MYKIAVENLPALFRKIAADQELYLPVKVSEQVNFKAWSEDAEVSLETPVSYTHLTLPTT